MAVPSLAGPGAVVAFIAVEVSAFVTVLVLARHQWFFADEWDFLVNRRLGSLTDLFRPHVGHWSTLPILVYRTLFHAFGLRTYLPYQLLVVTLHLVAAALLWKIIRRAGVHPWLSTAAASLFALFGSGYDDIAWAFQIGFDGALVLGLTQLILADHDGPLDRRDRLGLLAGAAGLMCAGGLAVIMTVIVGLATFIRRGWRVALFHVGPLAVIYTSWWLAIGREYQYSLSPGSSPNLGELAQWVKRSVTGSFSAMGQLQGVGVALAIVLILGVILSFGDLRTRGAAPSALLVGTFIFVVSTGWTRARPLLMGYATNSHYLDIITALALPAIALSMEAIRCRWKIVLPVMVLMLLLGVPGNAEKIARPRDVVYQVGVQTYLRQCILTTSRSPLAQTLPRSYRPQPFFDPDLTMGWLLDQKGQLPSPGPLNKREVATVAQGCGLPNRH